MEYVITILETEKRGLEKQLHEQNLMHRNMKLATNYMRKVKDIKRAIKVLKNTLLKN